MNPDTQTQDPVVDPLASIMAAEQLAHEMADNETGAGAAVAAEAPAKRSAQVYDFRNPMLLSPRELRKLKAHQEEFIQGLATRLSRQLRTEFSLKLEGVHTVAYQKLAETWGNPAHLILFKVEPLRGVSILEISHQLGLAMVDRLMGGPGHAPAIDQEISEIEKVLLEQTAQGLLDEWCSRWIGVKELKPVILAYENKGCFIQTATADTMMLVVSIEVKFSDCVGKMQMGFPYAALDPLIRSFNQGAEIMAVPTPPAPTAMAAPCQWNECFNDVCVPVTAEWQGLEMTARQMLALKVGDVLQMDAQKTQQINVRLADVLKFQGRPGTIAGQWAVQLTQVIDR